MTAPVNQLHLSFVAPQDRLLLRLATARSEIRLWITRRFVKDLWPVLLDALQTDPALAGHTDPQARGEVLSFQHEQAIQDTEFTNGYRAPPETRPLTQQPLLLTRASQEPVDPEHTRLTLITARDRSFQLTLDRKTIHSLCKLITDCVEKAGWDLDLPVVPKTSPSDPARRTIN